MEQTTVAFRRYNNGRSIIRVAGICFVSFVFIYIMGVLGSRSNARFLVLLPEILGLLILGILIFKNKRILLHPTLYVFFILFVIALISFIVEGKGTLIFVMGMRNYFKFIPYFLIPLVLKDASFIRIKDQFPKFILLVALVQLPVSLIQKIVYWGGTGDLIVGTLGNNSSGLLTTFLFMTIPLVVALIYEKKISLKQGVLLGLALFIPTTINETKTTLLYIIALTLMYTIMSNKINVKQKLSIFIGGGIVLSLFMWSYSKFSAYGSDRLEDTYSMVYSGDIYDKYYFKKDGTLNRIPAMQFAVANISANNYTFYFGVGPGNASDSILKDGLGFYFKKYPGYKIDSIQLARLIWEWGYIGLALWFLIYMILFLNALKLKNSIFNMWFTGIIAVVFIGMIYNNNLLADSLGYYFWFTGGLVAREIVNKKKYENNLDL